MRRSYGVVLLILVVVVSLYATTWAPAKIKCPICGETNSFYHVMSWGTYIYQWPEKFQYIFWPRTDSHSLYICKKCHFAAFMWDFESDEVKQKKAEILAALSGVELKSKETEYNKIPMSERLTVALKVYQVLHPGDDSFWCEFYRVEGYHYAREHNPAAAAEARRKTLELAEKMQADPKSQGSKKEWLYVSASMRHFLGDDTRAVQDLDAAATLIYKDQNQKDETNTNINGYLDDLIRQYKVGIKDGKINDPGTDEANSEN